VTIVAVVRRVSADDTDLLKDVRLRALREAPYAFWETLADVENDPGEEWIEWTASYAAPNTKAAAFVALADENTRQADGMAGGYLDPADETAVAVWGVWVDPRCRGEGIADDLLQAVEEWASLAGRPRLTLWVTTTSHPAIALYLRRGFRDTRRRREHVSDTTREEMFMEKRL
jgi:ribosomal protein S18 acetylase RimI-like enzyme